MQWFDDSILCIIDCMKVDRTMVFVDVERLCEIGWTALGLSEWLSLD